MPSPRKVSPAPSLSASTSVLKERSMVSLSRCCRVGIAPARAYQQFAAHARNAHPCIVILTLDLSQTQAVSFSPRAPEHAHIFERRLQDRRQVRTASHFFSPLGSS